MKELNISKIIAFKRHEKGITQDQLAEYIGVSKASVSKWETGQSYPDITFLPQIAMYFNISIDELIGYKPQMTKDDINKLYKKLSTDFAKKNFLDVYNMCKEYTKKYYSCYEFLIKIVGLYLNHFMLSKDINIQKEMIDVSLKLINRIKEESDNIDILNEAVQLESTIYLLTNKPDKVLDLLGEKINPIFIKEDAIAAAYKMLGNNKKAEEVLQIVQYQLVLAMVSNSVQLIMINMNDRDRAEKILDRVLKIFNAYDLDHLHLNSVGSLYIAAAMFYVNYNDYDKAIEFLKKYANDAENEEIYELHKDEYFDLISPWLSENTILPRDKKIIKNSILESVKNNPQFKKLEDLDDYKILIKRLENL